MIKKILYTLSAVGAFVYALPARAQEDGFVAISPIPGFSQQNADIIGFLESAFQLSIIIAALLTVVMIAIGGFQYMTNEAFPAKTDAKKRISEAILGLLIILGSWLILNTINPQILNFDVLQNLPEFQGDVDKNSFESGNATIYQQVLKSAECQSPREGYVFAGQAQPQHCGMPPTAADQYKCCQYNKAQEGAGTTLEKMEAECDGRIVAFGGRPECVSDNPETIYRSFFPDTNCTVKDASPEGFVFTGEVETSFCEIPKNDPRKCCEYTQTR